MANLSEIEKVSLVQESDIMRVVPKENEEIGVESEGHDVTNNMCLGGNESEDEIMEKAVVGCSDDVDYCRSDSKSLNVIDKSDDVLLTDSNIFEVTTPMLDGKTEGNVLVFAASCQETIVPEIDSPKSDFSSGIVLDSSNLVVNQSKGNSLENKVNTSETPEVSLQSSGVGDISCTASSNCSRDSTSENSESNLLNCALDAKSLHSSSVESSKHCSLSNLKVDVDKQGVLELIQVEKENFITPVDERFSFTEMNIKKESANEGSTVSSDSVTTEDKSVLTEIKVEKNNSQLICEENFSNPLESPQIPEIGSKDLSSHSNVAAINEELCLIQFPVKDDLIGNICDSTLDPSSCIQPMVESPYKDNSLVKKIRIRKKKTKESVLWPSTTLSGGPPSIPAFQRPDSEAHSYSVDDLNRIFNSWTITDVHPRKKYSPGKKYTSISTTSKLDSEFRFDFALPEEYSRNLSFSDNSVLRLSSGTSPTASASRKAVNKERKARKKEDRKKRRAAIRAKQEEEKGRNKEVSQKDGALVNCRFSLFEKHLQELPETGVGAQGKGTNDSNKSNTRSKSADDSKRTQTSNCEPQPASKIISQAVSLDHLSQQSKTLLTHTLLQDSSISAQASKPKKNKNKKTLIREVRNSKFGNQRKYDELGQLEKIADRIIKGDRKQPNVGVRGVAGTGHSSSNKKKKSSNTTSTMDVQQKAPGSPLPSSPTKKEKAQSPKKKLQKTFEEYWSVDAVTEGIRTGTVIESPIRINPKKYTEAYVTSPDGGQDILIDGIVDRNRALEGDLVALLIKSASEWKKSGSRHSRRRSKSSNGASMAAAVAAAMDGGIEDDSIDGLDESLPWKETENAAGPQITGKVIKILSEQHSRKCVGYLKLMKNKNDKFALFSPRDARVPRMHIPREKCPQDFWADPASKQDIIYLAKIKKWVHGMFALGEILEEVGETADPGVETTALLMDNDLDVTPYPEALSNMIPVLPEVICEEEVAKRLDLRKECIFTIDPMTAKDLDDAMSCKELENGNLEVGVHISDVTHFLHEGTPLDDEVAKRATSVYLVEKVHHMLPLNLCLQCSLLPGRDKLAYSVIWEMTKDCTVVSQKITRSVIKSCVKLAYEHAQIMLDNPDEDLNPEDFPQILNSFSLLDISKAVRHMQNIAVQLRSKRFEGGALRIDQTKVFVHLNEQGIPDTVEEYIHNESHGLIEEFMLLANMTTAKFIHDKYPDIAFLRCHPMPHKWLLEGLQEAMASRGIHLNVTSAGALQTSLSRYAGEDFLSKTRLMVLNALCAKTMARAKYFCAGEYLEKDFWHYALSVPFYTHFTSPIRRYADVMVHRLLNAALGYDCKPKWTKQHVQSIASNCNKKKFGAKMAGEQSVKLYLALYVRHRQPVIEDAVVIDVKDHSFDVNICSLGLAMRVYVTKMDVELCYDANEKVSAMRVKWNPSDKNPVALVQVVELFSIVSVKVVCENKSLKLEATLLPPTNRLAAVIPEDSIPPVKEESEGL